MQLPAKGSGFGGAHHPYSAFLVFGGECHYAAGFFAEWKDDLGGAGLVDPDGDGSCWQVELVEIEFSSVLSLYYVDGDMWVLWWVVHRLSSFFSVESEVLPSLQNARFLAATACKGVRCCPVLLT